MPRHWGDWSIFAALCLALATAPQAATAQDVRDGETLPKNVGALIISPAYTGGTDRFGPRWHVFSRESILTDFADIDLTQVIAGDQAQGISNLLGGPLGITNFRASQSTVGVNFTLGYGITDRLSVAAVLPYAHVTYDLEAWLARPASNAPLAHYRVRDPKAIECPNGELRINDPADLFNKVLEDGGEGYQFNVQDLRKALSSTCLGYKDPMDSSSVAGDGYVHGTGKRTYSGFRDLILGAKYQWWHTELLRLSSLVYVVTPTGSPDDPDDLFDPAFGDGQWDAALLIGATVPVDKFRFSVSTGYEIQFGDSLVRRLAGLSFSDELEGRLARNEITEAELYDKHLDEGTSIPIVTAYEKAEVKRKLGDNIYIYSSVGYELLEWLSLGVTLDFIHHFRDRITDTGRRVADGTRFKTSNAIRAEVEAEIAAGTIAEEDREEQLRLRLPESAERKAAGYAWHTVRDSVVASFGININTLPMFLRDEFPIPLMMGVSATMPVAGKNIDALDSISLSLVVPFATGEVKDPAEYGFDDIEGQGLPWP